MCIYIYIYIYIYICICIYIYILYYICPGLGSTDGSVFFIKGAMI